MTHKSKHMSITDFLCHLGGDFDAGVDVLMDAVASDMSIGYCVCCGAEAGGVEPDREEMRCESCGEHSVYGAEQILFDIEGSL
jgi:hypothetical protein